MPTIRISSITEGLIVTNDVKDLNGRVIVRDGTCLQERHIQLFKTWGITEVDVVGAQGPGEAKIVGAEGSPKEKQDRAAKLVAEEALKEVFSRNDLHHPMIRELFEICVARKAKLPW